MTYEEKEEMINQGDEQMVDGVQGGPLPGISESPREPNLRTHE